MVIEKHKSGCVAMSNTIFCLASSVVVVVLVVVVGEAVVVAVVVTVLAAGSAALEVVVLAVVLAVALAVALAVVVAMVVVVDRAQIRRACPLAGVPVVPPVLKKNQPRSLRMKQPLGQLGAP